MDNIYNEADTFPKILDTCMVDGLLNISKLRCEANKRRFKYKYENLDRIIFFIEPNTRISSSSPYIKHIQYAGGLVCEYVGHWVQVCTPVPVFERRTENTIIDDEYFVFPVYDATIINLYYSQYSNEWMYGTKRSFNIINSTWRDVKFSSILEPLTKIIENGELDIAKTYIYAIVDPRIHIFNKTAACYLIGSTDGVEFELGGTSHLTVAEAFDRIDNAMNTFINDGVVELGYIFRNGKHSYIVETDLLLKIRDILYKPVIQRNVSREVNKIMVSNMVDMDYIVARAYFNHYSSSLQLFPIFEELFQQIRDHMLAIVNYCCLRLHHSEVEEFAPYNDFFTSNYTNLLRIKQKKSDIPLFDRIKNYIYSYNKKIETFFQILKYKK